MTLENKVLKLRVTNMKGNNSEEGADNKGIDNLSKLLTNNLNEGSKIEDNLAADETI